MVPPLTVIYCKLHMGVVNLLMSHVDEERDSEVETMRALRGTMKIVFARKGSAGVRKEGME